jgi:phosphoglycolate phosphatase
MLVSAKPLLVLWDIDHTLIDGGGVSRRGYAAAFRRISGRELEQAWQFDGRTELAAATDVLRLHGIDPGNGTLERFTGLIVEELRDRAAEYAHEGRVLPGAIEALRALQAITGVRQSVLTGNLYPIAVLKLTALGIDGYLDLRIGAFGGDAFERTALPAAAFARIEKLLGHRLGGDDTVIIGDTPRDMATATAVGARAIGVTTGTSTADQLGAAGADVVFADLTDTDAVVRAVRGNK